MKNPFGYNSYDQMPIFSDEYASNRLTELGTDILRGVKQALLATPNFEETIENGKFHWEALFPTDEIALHNLIDGKDSQLEFLGFSILAGVEVALKAVNDDVYENFSSQDIKKLVACEKKFLTKDDGTKSAEALIIVKSVMC